LKNNFLFLSTLDALPLYIEVELIINKHVLVSRVYGIGCTKYRLTPWRRVLLEKLIVAQPFMELEFPLPCSQKPATEACVT